MVPDRIRTLLASLGIDEAIPRLEAAVAVAERTGDATALAELRRRLGVVRESTAAVARP